MTGTDWDTIRDDATTKYGDPPGADLERRILIVYQHRPTLVLDAIERVGGRYQAGTVRSFWAVLALDVEEKAGRGEHRPQTAAAGNDREKKIQRAEQWIRAAGIHFDQPDEVLDELFNTRGLLRHWADDTFLQQRMHTLWMELRPTGERLEADMLARAKHWQATTGKTRRTQQQPNADDNPFL